MLKSILLRKPLLPINITNLCTKINQHSRQVRISKTNRELIPPVNNFFEQNGTVLISKSANIYQNLALEEWIYRNYDFNDTDHHMLLLWCNKPAVVVGRHQNIWSEVNQKYCQDNNISIVRRNSGGGTVYHDQQNLNISFITSKKNYNRKRNLGFLLEVLLNNYNIETIISEREDLIIKDTGEKVSGTASKLNGYNSYHHCTLLVDVDRIKLRQSLRTTQPMNSVIRIESNATKSVSSPILNLKSLNCALSIESLISNISESFNSKLFGGQSLDTNSNIITLDTCEIDRKLAGIEHIQSQFESWQWIYAKTPKYCLVTEISLPGGDSQLRVTIDKGLITSVNLELAQLEGQVSQALVGTRWNEIDLLGSLEFLHREVPEVEIADRLSFALLACYKFTTE